MALSTHKHEMKGN